MNAWKENYFVLLNQHVKLYESNGQWMKFDINQVEILDLSILEVDNNLKSFPTCPQFCMIVCVICKWSPPPSLLSLVLSIMIMGFRDREVIAVNPVLSKQKHKCRSSTTIADTHDASYLKRSWISRISAIYEMNTVTGFNWKCGLRLVLICERGKSTASQSYFQSLSTLIVFYMFWLL